MQSNIKNKPVEKEQELKFPCLMESNTTKKFVVVATTRRTGFVLWSENVERPVGYYTDMWVDFYREDCWKKFDGVVELANE